MSVLMRIVWLALLLAISSASDAHEMSMAEIELRETRPSECLWQWTASGARPAGDELTPGWPRGCEAQANLLRCGPSGLSGELTIDGVGRRYSAALVKVF